MVINVYAPDSAKNFEGTEKFTPMLERVMLEGRKEDARWCFVAEDLNVELGLSCMEDGDDLQGTYGPKCWYAGLVRRADTRGFKNADWLDVKTEFNCKAPSAWLSCGDGRESFHTQSLENVRTNIAAELHDGPNKLRRGVLHSQRHNHAAHGIITLCL